MGYAGINLFGRVIWPFNVQYYPYYRVRNFMIVNTSKCSQDCRVMYMENTSNWVSSLCGKRSPLLQFQVSARFAIMSETASPSFECRDEFPVEDVPGGLDVESDTVESKTYMFNQRKYESMAELHTAVLLSRTSGRAQWWRSTSVTVKRNDSDEVISVSLSCAACAKSISLGNPSKFWTSHKSNCKQRGKDVVGEVIDSKGTCASFYACLSACMLLALV
jgi:hypothetical protein